MKDQDIPNNNLIDNLAEYAKVWHNSELQVVDNLKIIGNSFNSDFVGKLSSNYFEMLKIIAKRRFSMEESFFKSIRKKK